jgi:hypothetical protein
MSTWHDPVPLNTAAESEEEFVIATSAAMRSKSDQSSGLSIRPERFNSIDEPEIVVVSSIVTLKVDPCQDCTCTVENAGEINESRNVIVSKTKVRPIISNGLLGTFILYIVRVLPGINQSNPDLAGIYTFQSLF